MNNDDATPTYAAREARFEATRVESPSNCALNVIKIGRRDPKTEEWLIRDVTFSVNFGDRLGVLGPSGAGKTVLLRALALLDPLDTGTVLFQGQVVGGDEVPRYRSQVIYLHQKPALQEGTVEDNLRLPFALKTHRERRFDRGLTAELLASLGRDTAFLDKSSRDLSGGEAQIVALGPRDSSSSRRCSCSTSQPHRSTRRRPRPLKQCSTAGWTARTDQRVP